MLITLRDENQKLLVKDMLDIDFDMAVEEKNGKFYVMVNRRYRFDEEFKREDVAEHRMLEIARARNNLENELRDY